MECCINPYPCNIKYQFVIKITFSLQLHFVHETNAWCTNLSTLSRRPNLPKLCWMVMAFVSTNYWFTLKCQGCIFNKCVIEYQLQLDIVFIFVVIIYQTWIFLIFILFCRTYFKIKLSMWYFNRYSLLGFGVALKLMNRSMVPAITGSPK